MKTADNPQYEETRNHSDPKSNEAIYAKTADNPQYEEAMNHSDPKSNETVYSYAVP